MMGKETQKKEAENFLKEAKKQNEKLDLLCDVYSEIKMNTTDNQQAIDDFIDSHSIDNIIKIAEDEVRNEMKTPNKTINREEDSTKIGEGTYVVNKPSPEQLTNIHNIVNILYDDPATRSPAEDIVKDLIEEPVSEDIVNMIGTQGVSELFKENNNNVDNISLNCRTIDDVMGILNQIRR